ncbi:hypothetical protein ES703_90272 [subsurface metagenome]
MENFKFCYRGTFVNRVFKPGVVNYCFFRNILALRNPAVPLTKEADKKRPTRIDSVQAHVYDVSILCGISLGHPPPQVNINHMKLSSLTPFA